MKRFIRSILAFGSGILGLFLVAPVVAMAIPFWLVATATSQLARVLRPRYQHAAELYEFDADVGWKARANLRSRYVARGGDVCRIRTDEEGWAGSASLEEAHVVAFGDSFVFGYGVDWEDSFTELDPTVRVKPIGAPGYSMVQPVLLMRELAPKLRGKLVIWFLCIENDLYDNLRPNKPNYYRSPFVRRLPGGNPDAWEIVTAHLEPRPWTLSSEKADYYPMFARLHRPTEISRRTYSACRFLIDQARKICLEAGARLVVATIPNKHQLTTEGQDLLRSFLDVDDADFDVGYPDREIGAICRELEVPFSAGRSFLDSDDYKTRDAHWNRRGHRSAARWLAKLIDLDGLGRLGELELSGGEAPDRPKSPTSPRPVGAER